MTKVMGGAQFNVRYVVESEADFLPAEEIERRLREVFPNMEEVTITATSFSSMPPTPEVDDQLGENLEELAVLFHQNQAFEKGIRKFVQAILACEDALAGDAIEHEAVENGLLTCRQVTQDDLDQADNQLFSTYGIEVGDEWLFFSEAYRAWLDEVAEEAEA